MAPYAPYFATEPATYSQISPVRVTFLGNTNVLIEDGETRILTDGYFTRPSLREAIFGATPSKEKIRTALAQAGIDKLTAVIPLHTHIDHALDSAEVGFQSGAKLIGSGSLKNIAEGWVAFHEGKREYEDYEKWFSGAGFQMVMIGEKVRIGQFNVTFLPTGHIPVPGAKKTIKKPLKPPAGMLRYKPAPVFALLVEHSGKKILIIGSAGKIEDEDLQYWETVNADVVLLGIAGIGKRSSNYVEMYFRQMVDDRRAKKIVPVHWDELFEEPQKPLSPQSGFYGFLSRMKKSLEITCREVAQQRPDVELIFLPYGEDLSIFELSTRANAGYGNCPSQK
ncbi:MAG: MBL fold metallo-hydrolase [Pseudomonadota bacterium]